MHNLPTLSPQPAAPIDALLQEKCNLSIHQRFICSELDKMHLLALWNQSWYCLKKRNTEYLQQILKRVYTCRGKAHVLKQEYCCTPSAVIAKWIGQRLWVLYACNLQEHCSTREVQLLLSPERNKRKRFRDVVESCTRTPLNVQQ